MITPERAIVRPRVTHEENSARIPLDAIVRDIAERHRNGVIVVSGAPGIGCTTALRHVAATIHGEHRVSLFDTDVKPAAGIGQGSQGLSIIAMNSVTTELLKLVRTIPGFPAVLDMLRLAPWDEDDVIEYLLTAHPTRTTDVMARLKARRSEWPAGMPGTWRLVLDAMAADGDISGPHAALLANVNAAGIRPDEYRVLERHFVIAACGADDEKNRSTRRILAQLAPELRRLLDDPWVQRQLAIEALRRALVELEAPFLFEVAPRTGETVHPEIPRLLGPALRDDEPALTRLHAIAAQCTPQVNRALAVSVLLAAGGKWSPQEGMIGADLRGAALSGIHQPAAALRFVRLIDADLTTAELRDATLTGCNFTKADLTRATLCRANAEAAHFENAFAAGADFSDAALDGANFGGAELSGADFQRASLAAANLRNSVLNGARFGAAKLRHCDLRGARLGGADFRAADLWRAQLNGADLRTADWNGANLHGADLTNCNLEQLEIKGAQLQRARLVAANLTHARLAGADLQHATLCDALLGMVHLEGADLRGADLRGVVFHLGSSRSGMLFDAPAGEGSRTGYYTDEFDERTFRDPEEIRVANLRGTDLRGATLIGVDFYLVDLRDARFDPWYENHLRSCGAILSDRSAA